MNDTQLRNLKPREKSYRVSDGGGLYVQVEPSGGKLWRLAYRYHGKQKTLALGKYPEVGRADARARRDAAKRQLSNGVDPGEARKLEKRQSVIAANTTFGAIAKEWFDNRKSRWVESYSSRIWGRIESDLFILQNRPIGAITPLEVLDVLREVEARGAIESAKRIKQYASHVFQYAIVTNRVERDPTQDIGRALKPLRGSRKHRHAMPTAEIPGFWKRLGDDRTSLAIKLVVLTFVRTNEIRFASPDEFDLENKLWRIPAERMKMRRPHLVPLSPEAVRIVKAMDGQFSMSENTMLYALYRMGYHGKATIHGFRATASTALNEAGWNRDWIERQLAHADDAVRGAYNAAEWLDGRRRMMNAWADYVCGAGSLSPSA